MIIQFSPIRSGSTLIYNILKFINNNKINKVHNIHKSYLNKNIIITYRNPLDSIISSIQRYGQNINNDTILIATKEWLKNGGYDLIDNYQFLKENKIMLKYENFYNNFDYIFNKLNINDNSIKTKISNELNINSVKLKINKFSSFSQYNKNTHFHGKHISIDNGKINKYKKYINKSQIKLIYDFIHFNLNDKWKFFLEQEKYKIDY